MDRIKLMREKEKEVKDLWQDFEKDLKYLLEPEFDYKEYFRDVIEGLIFILFFGAMFILLWFGLP